MPLYAAAVDRIFEDFTDPGSAGCAVGVIRNGDLEYATGYGLASIEHRIPFGPSTVVHLGSMAKQFTGMLVALLVDDGALCLDDDIREHLPELHDFGSKVTVRHLVHHTSGLRGTYPDLFVLGGWGMTDRMTTEDVLRLMSAQRELNYPPGDEFLYINSGYTLLALIAERAAGEPFGALAKRRIFDPLGMADTSVRDDHTAVMANAAGGYYREDGGSWKQMVVTDSVIGSTNVWSTVEDLARWDRNFISCEVGGGSVVAQIHETGKLNDGSALGYAFGLEASPDNTHRGWRVVEHGGQHGGHCVHMIRFPDAGVSVVVVFNLFLWNAREYALQVADLLVRDESPPATEAVAIERPALGDDADLGELVGAYFNDARAALRTVAVDDDRLTYEHLPLTPIGPARFVVDADPSVEVSFAEEEGRRFVQTDTPSGLYRYEYVDPPRIESGALCQMGGTYECPELAVRWVVEAAEDHLVVHRPRFPDTVMTPVFRDGFVDSWDPIVGFPFSFLIRFDRDSSDAVVGCRVSGDRVRNLRFLRVGAG